MLTRTLRRRRFHGQAGQTLILALAFIAFFGVTIVAVLRVADLPGQQRAISETTATNDSGDEGGAAYAAADAGRTDVQLSCAGGDSGQLTMQTSGHQANYSVNSCNPGGASATGGGGQSCLLCLLNQVAIGANPGHTQSTVVYTANRGVTTTGGNDYINGSINSGDALTATPAGAKIFLLSPPSGTVTCTACSPGATPFEPAIADPYLSSGPTPLVAPSPIAGKPSTCPNVDWNPASGCTATFSGGNNPIQPGLYASLQTTGGANVTFAAGIYVFSGPLEIAGSGTIDGTSGVTLYLACGSYGSTGAACPTSGSGRTGGCVNITGNGAESFTAPSSGVFNSVAILADPNLLDPGTCVQGMSETTTGATMGCLSGTGCALDIQGNGANFTGTQDLRSAGADFQGNGGDNVTLGRFIANSLFINVSKNATAGLNLSGAGLVTTTACGVFDDAVSSSGGPGTGRAIIQSQCGSTKGVIDFNYTP